MSRATCSRPSSSPATATSSPSFATAVGLFKALLAAVLLLGSNVVAKRLGHTGIW